MLFFRSREFQDFWFQTGTDLREIDGVHLPARDFADYRADPDRPVPVMYQSGYLTIKSYDPSLRFYTLGYPNAEVKNGFLGFLLPDYTGQSSIGTSRLTASPRLAGQID